MRTMKRGLSLIGLEIADKTAFQFGAPLSLWPTLLFTSQKKSTVAPGLSSISEQMSSRFSVATCSLFLAIVDGWSRFGSQRECHWTHSSTVATPCACRRENGILAVSMMCCLSLLVAVDCFLVHFYSRTKRFCLSHFSLSLITCCSLDDQSDCRCKYTLIGQHCPRQVFCLARTHTTNNSILSTSQHASE